MITLRAMHLQYSVLDDSTISACLAYCCIVHPHKRSLRQCLLSPAYLLVSSTMMQWSKHHAPQVPLITTVSG